MTENHHGSKIYDENFYKKNHKTEYAAKAIIGYVNNFLNKYPGMSIGIAKYHAFVGRSGHVDFPVVFYRTYL